MCYARRQRSSWARIKLSKNGIWNILRCLISFFELDCSFTFVWVVFSKNCEICSCTYYMLCTSLIVVQFSMTERSFRSLYHRSSRQPDYYITTFSLCQYLFSSFFQKLFRNRLGVAVVSRSRWQLVYYSMSDTFCQLWVLTNNVALPKAFDAFLYK